VPISIPEGAAPEQGQEPGKTQWKFRFDSFPRWLSYSGLPQALGPADWSVFKAVVELDHQCMRRPKGRKGLRSGKGNTTFAMPQGNIVEMTGLSPRAVRYSLNRLTETALLDYAPGKGRSWCEFTVNTKTLLALFSYVAPLLRPAHGGLWNVGAEALPDEGERIYGQAEAEGVIVKAAWLSWEKLWALQKTAATIEHPTLPEVERVAEICQIGQ